MRYLLVLGLSLTALVLPSTGAAAHSPLNYSRSQCTWNGSVLYCERTFQVTETVTYTTYEPDPTCAESGLRTFKTTQTERTTWLVWDYFSGPAPLSKWNLAGDEAPINTEILSSTGPVDYGCTPYDEAHI